LYFDWVIYVSQAKLTDATGAARATLARIPQVPHPRGRDRQRHAVDLHRPRP
jgi:hypothetical protein